MAISLFHNRMFLLAIGIALMISGYLLVTTSYLQSLFRNPDADDDFFSSLSRNIGGSILREDGSFPIERLPEWALNAKELGFLLPPEIWGVHLWNKSNSIVFIAPTATRKWQEIYPKPHMTYPEQYFEHKCVFNDSKTYSNVQVIPDSHHNVWLLSCDIPPEEQVLLNANKQVRVNLLDHTFGILSRDYHVKSLADTETHHKIAVCTMVLDEGYHIAEWLEYMQIMKVTKFYIYDNGSKDSTMQVLQPYIEKGLVTVVDYSAYPYHGQVNSQVLAFNDCIYRFRDYNEFQLQTDVDEYPFSMNNNIKDLDQLIEMCKSESPYFGMAALVFQHFGSFNFSDSKLLAEAYHRTSQPDKLTPQQRKPIYWLENVRAVSIHLLTTGGPTYLVDPINMMRLNHYWRIGRGTMKEEDFKQVLSVFDDSMKPFVKQIKARLGRD